MSGTSQTPASSAARAGEKVLAPENPTFGVARTKDFFGRFAEGARALVRDRLRLLTVVFFGVLWLLLFNRLHTEWIVNELYAYGWAVPFLALFLFFERWRERPAPAVSRPSAWWLVLPVALILTYFPARIINEANPDWVKINFYLTSLTVLVSFCALFAIGRLRYVLWFAFPLFFVYTALPWPVMMEENLVQLLTRWNTNASAELLTLGGLPAIATGNIIQVGNSWVNVAEACSGIRSLQTAFMMSLFLGEFYRIGWLNRVLLMLSSFVVAFGLNIARTMSLTWINTNYGGETMEHWHDIIGNFVMIGCLVGLWLLSLGFVILKKKFGDRSLLSALTIGVSDFRKAKVSSATSSAAVSAQAPVVQPFPAPFLIFSLVVLVFSEVGTEAWYRYHEAHLAPPPEWSINWPRDARKFHEDSFPDRTRAILKYNEAQTASWETREGFMMQMYAIRWLPGRVSKFLSGAHYPTVCLPATGLKFQREMGPYVYAAGGADVRFTAFLFESKDRPVYVFHAIVEDRPAPDGENIDYRQVSTSERIDSVLRGHRNLGQRVVGISIYGASSLDEAEYSVRHTLDQILKITPPKSLPKTAHSS